MKRLTMFDAVFAGSIAAVLVGVVGAAVAAIGWQAVSPGAAGGAAAIGGLMSALIATPPLIGHLLGAQALRHVVSGYAFALLGLTILGLLAYMYVPAVQAVPTLLAAFSAAGVRLSQLTD